MTSEGLAPIHFCSMKSSTLPDLKYLLSHPLAQVDINCRNYQDGATPLMISCISGTLETVTFLLEREAIVNQEDNQGRTALFYATKGGHLKLIELLANHNACLNLRDNDNATIIHHLITSHDRIPMDSLMQILRYLVNDKGLSVNYRLLDGTTSLHEACRRGLEEVVQYLIKNGAAMEAKRNGWETPLWSLVKMTGEFPNRKEMIMLMFEMGANFEEKSCLGMTMLEYAKRISKDDVLIAGLEEVCRIVRTRRIKEMSNKRREILGHANTNTTSVSIIKNVTSKIDSLPVAPRTPPKGFPAQPESCNGNIDSSNSNTNGEDNGDSTSSCGSNCSSGSNSSSSTSSSGSGSSNSSESSSESDNNNTSNDDDDANSDVGNVSPDSVEQPEGEGTYANNVSPVSSSDDEAAIILSNATFSNDLNLRRRYNAVLKRKVEENVERFIQMQSEAEKKETSSSGTDSDEDEEDDDSESEDDNNDDDDDDEVDPSEIQQARIINSRPERQLRSKRICNQEDNPTVPDNQQVPKKIKRVRRMAVAKSSDSE